MSEDPGENRVESRADHLLPEERRAGTEDAEAQAGAILSESDLRESEGVATDTPLQNEGQGTVVPAEPPD